LKKISLLNKVEYSATMQRNASRMIKGKQPTSKPTNQNEESDSKWQLVAIVTVFCLFLVGIYLSYKQMNGLEPDEYAKVKLPRSIEDARQLGGVLLKYINEEGNYYQLTFTFFFVYIFLQTFAIPGSIFMSVISGFLYGTYLALCFVCLASGIGATGCYFISYYFGGKIAQKYIPERIENWKVEVDKRRDDLFSYILFLRVTPILPNWLINVVSPIIDIPVNVFFFATLIGVAPLSYIAVSAGTQLNSMMMSDLKYNWNNMLIVLVCAILALVVPKFCNKFYKKEETTSVNKQE